ncbi:DNA cytosine methyltransferase, partial [Klebsiella pneumoniae]
NLKSHDKGKTFKVIMDTLDELGYEVADAAE